MIHLYDLYAKVVVEGCRKYSAGAYAPKKAGVARPHLLFPHLTFNDAGRQSSKVNSFFVAIISHTDILVCRIKNRAPAAIQVRLGSSQCVRGYHSTSIF